MEQVKTLVQERKFLFEALKELNCVERVYPSQANFILTRFKIKDMAALLESKHILVRDYPPRGQLAQCIRFSVGSEKENKKLIAILKEVTYA
jgi:histidinol-phosphate aminotransferase